MQFWKPGTTAPGSSLDRATESEGALLSSAPVSTAFVGLQQQRERLPIFQYSAFSRRLCHCSVSNGDCRKAITVCRGKVWCDYRSCGNWFWQDNAYVHVNLRYHRTD